MRRMTTPWLKGPSIIVATLIPVAAAVQGRCLGGAFEVVAACHEVFAAEGAIFAVPEIKLGVFPPALAAFGHLRLGAALAERMIRTGSELRATDPAALAWLTELVPGEDPVAAALAWYHKHLAPLSASSLRVATRAARLGNGLWAAAGAPLDAMERLYIGELLPTADATEGIAAFLEHRAPAWSHR